MELNLRDLESPDFLALPPGEQYKGRREVYTGLMKNPNFRGLPVEERSKVLFGESREPKDEALPKPTSGEMFQSGVKHLFAPPAPPAKEFSWPHLPGPTEINRALAPLEIVGSIPPFPQLGNLVSTGAERISDYLKDSPIDVAPGKWYGPANVISGVTKGVGDFATSAGLARLLSLVKAPLVRALPTIKEKVGSLNAGKAAQLAENEKTASEAGLAVAQGEKSLAIEANQRLSDLDKLANEAQATTAGGQAERLKQIPAAKMAIQEQGAKDITAVEQQLAGQQAGVGMEAAQAGAPVGPKRLNFDKRYTALEQTADQIPISPVNLNVKAHRLLREPGIPGTPTLPSERSSAAIARTLTEADPEEIAGQVRRALTSGGEAKPVNYNEMTKMVLGPATSEDVTIGELLRARKRLRAAGRAAYSADHKNLGRQWGDLEDAITQDIQELAKTDKNAAAIYRQSKNLDKDYFKKKSVDWYAEGVDQAFDPANGVWDRKRFTKWWEKHADSTNNDRDLRRLLGDRYDGTKGLVEDMQKATELNIEQAAAQAARNINRRMGGELRDIGAREKQVGKIGKEVAGEIQTTREAARGDIGKEFATRRGELVQSEKGIEASRATKADAIQKDIESQVEKITGKPYSESAGRWVGPLLILHGATGVTAGIVTGTPLLVQSGAMGIGMGALTIMNHAALIKLINNHQGASIMRRLVRAAPGTGEAIAASSAASRILQGLKEKEGEEGTAQVPGTVQPSTGAKETLLNKYGIE